MTIIVHETTINWGKGKNALFEKKVGKRRMVTCKGRNLCHVSIIFSWIVVSVREEV